MPTYTYRCLDVDCAELTETIHGMQENPEILCAVCEGETQRIILYFPHIRFDWKAYSVNDDNMRMVLHAAKTGKSTPASEQANRA